jgi:hypothetical protein
MTIAPASEDQFAQTTFHRAANAGLVGLLAGTAGMKSAIHGQSEVTTQVVCAVAREQ